MFLFYKKLLTNTISTSPPPLLRVVFNSSYLIFSIFCPICPYMEIRSQTPGILNFFEFSYFIRSAFQITFQRVLNHSSKLYLTQVIPFFYILPICPYMEIRSQTPGILNFFEFSYFIRSALLIWFQRTLNYSPKLFLTQVIPFFLYFKNTIVWLVAYFENKISTLFGFLWTPFLTNFWVGFTV